MHKAELSVKDEIIESTNNKIAELRSQAEQFGTDKQNEIDVLQATIDGMNMMSELLTALEQARQDVMERSQHVLKKQEQVEQLVLDFYDSVTIESMYNTLAKLRSEVEAMRRAEEAEGEEEVLSGSRTDDK